MELKNIFKILVIISLILIIIDQTSKIVINNLVNEDIEIIPNILTITKLENEGVAFGLNNNNLGNIGLCLIILIFVLNYIISQRERMTKTSIIFLSLIVSGGFSNIIDRIFKGAVFDFIKLGESFPIFNIADVCIVLGWLLFLINFAKETAIDIKAKAPRKNRKVLIIM